MNGENQNHESHPELERIARLNPHAKRSVDHDALLERGLHHHGDNLHLRARFNLGRGAWAGLSAGVAAAIVVAAVMAPSIGKGSHYLFSATGYASGASSADKYAPMYGGPISSGAIMRTNQPAFDINYVAGPALSDQAGSGHIYQLAKFADTKALANKLADFTNLGAMYAGPTTDGYEYYSNQKIETSSPGPDATPGSVSGSTGSGSASITGSSSAPSGSTGFDSNGFPLEPSTQVYGSVSGSNTQATSINYNDNGAYNFVLCYREGMTPVPTYCPDIKAQHTVTLTEAQAYAADFLGALGVETGTSLNNTTDGGYLLKAVQGSQGGIGGVIAYSVAAGVGSSAGTTTTTPVGAPVNVNDPTSNGVTVRAQLVANGMVSPVEVDFSWNEGYTGVAAVNGTLAKLVDRGSFDTISAKAAVDRLNQNTGLGAYAVTPDNWSKNSQNSIYFGGSALAKEIWVCARGPLTGGVADKATPSDPNSTVPTDPNTTAPAPVPSSTTTASSEPAPTPSDSPTCGLDMTGGVPNVDVTITKAEDGLVMLWDSNSSQWLVPGYNFYDDSGYLASTYSVVDGVIDTTQPSVQPMTK